MKSIDTKIAIGKYTFNNRSKAIQIETSWRSLSQQATIQLPGLVSQLGKAIKPGLPVEIYIGYDNDLSLKYSGYVARVKHSTPFTIECEDEFYNLKKATIKPASWSNVSLLDLLRYILPGAKFNVNDIAVGPFRIDSVIKNKAEVLEQIKEMFGIAIYYRAGWFAGLPYTDNTGRNVKLQVETNCKADSLEYRDKDSVTLKVKAVSIDRANKRTEVEVGDTDGEIRTVHFYNLSKMELTKRANQEYERFKVDGYKGTVSTRLKPVVNHGDIVALSDLQYPERDGSYLVDSVKITVDATSGIKQEIEIGGRAV